MPERLLIRARALVWPTLCILLSAGAWHHLGAQLTASVPLMADDSDATAFLKEGTGFLRVASRGGYRGGVHTGAGGNPPWFTFANVAPGTYDILETWPVPAHGAQAPTAVQHTVYAGDYRTLAGYVTDQSRAPNGVTYDGAIWERVGTLKIASRGTVYVALQPHPTSPTVADAILLLPQGAQLTPATSSVSSPSFSSVAQGPWAFSSASVRSSSSLLSATADSSTRYPSSVSQPPAPTSSAAVTPIDIPADDGWCACTPGPFVNGVGGCTKGPGCTLHIDACLTTVVTACPVANRMVYGPTVFLRDDSQGVRDGYVIQNGATTLFTRGSFSLTDSNSPSKGYNRTALLAPRVQGPYINARTPAQWVFKDLPNGRYAAYVRWIPGSLRTTAARYVINESRPGVASTLATVVIDQTQEPPLSAFGTRWARLYEGTFSPSQSIVVTLKPSETGEVSADAVMLVRLDGNTPSSVPPPMPSSTASSVRAAPSSSAPPWTPTPSSIPSPSSAPSSSSQQAETPSSISTPSSQDSNVSESTVPSSTPVASFSSSAITPSSATSESAAVPTGSCGTFGICLPAPSPGGPSVYLTFTSTFDQGTRSLVPAPLQQCYSFQDERFVDCAALDITPLPVPPSDCDVAAVDNGWQGTSLRVTDRRTRATIDIPVRNPSSCTSRCPYGSCVAGACTENPAIPVTHRALWWPTVDASCTTVHAAMVSFYNVTPGDYRGALMRYRLDWQRKDVTATMLAELAPQGSDKPEYTVDPTDPQRIAFTSHPPIILPSDAATTRPPIPGDPVSNTYVWERGTVRNITHVAFDPALPKTAPENWDLQYASVIHPYRFVLGTPKSAPGPCPELDCTAPEGCRYMHDAWSNGCRVSCGELTCVSSSHGGVSITDDGWTTDPVVPDMPFAPVDVVPAACEPLACDPPAGCAFRDPIVEHGCTLSCGALECAPVSSDACTTQGNGSKECAYCLLRACREHADDAALQSCTTDCEVQPQETAAPSWWEALFFWRW